MSLPIGTMVYPTRPSRVRALAGLFNPKLTSGEAVSQVMYALFGFVPEARVLRLNRSISTITIAPPGAGKSRGILAPFLLENDENAVVVDIKGELFRLTANRRLAMGHKVYPIDPWRVVTQNPAATNPFDLENPNDPESLDFVRDLAESIVVRSPHDDPHFSESAELHIGGAAAGLMNLFDEKHRHLGSVTDILADRLLLDRVINGLKNHTGWGGILSRIGHTMSHAAPEERESILSTCNRALRFMTSPAAASSLMSSNFDPRELITGRATIYLIVPAHHLRPMAGLVRLWLSTFHRVVLKRGAQ